MITHETTVIDNAAHYRTTPEPDGYLVFQTVGSVTKFDSRHAKRVQACVNACAGIADPEGAIRKAREVMLSLLADPYLSKPLNADRMNPVRMALAALGG